MDITKNKRYKTYTRISRYSNTPVMYNILDGKEQCGVSYYLEKDSPFKLHTIEAGDTLDTLALYYYGNPIYYWMIADFNDIFDPF